MSGKIYEGDIGTIIDIDMQETITGATNLKLYVMKPETQAIVEWTPEINGTDTLRYTIVEDDLSEVGEYLIQPYLTLSGWTGRGETVKMVVSGYYD